MHPDRKAAEIACKKAFQIARKAEDGTCEETWLKAHNAAMEANKLLAQMVLKYPTWQEKRRQDEMLYLHSIGMRD